jgi:glycosyltransferase involved in cell wall biosynthesis
MDMRASVIVPVYNAVRALELVLAGYCRQSSCSFELIIADDGSGPEVCNLIEVFSRSAPFPVRYIRQPDEGYRKTKILNEAVRAAATAHLIFADADCIPHREFVQAHCAHIEPRTVLCGRRVNLPRKLSASLIPPDVHAGRLERHTPFRVLLALFSPGSHWDEGLLLRNRALHRWVNHKEPALLGCNFSLEKSLLEEVNGFNEDFTGYSGEDTELEYRLRLAGARFSWIRHRAIQYHLYHPVRAKSQSNAAALERTRLEGRAACRNGLHKDRRQERGDRRQ